MDEILDKLKEIWSGLSSKMKMIVIGAGVLVALTVLIVYVASESHEEKIERFQSEIRPYYQDEMSSCLKSFPLFGVKLEGDMAATDSEGWFAGAANTDTELLKNKTMIFNLELAGPDGIEYKQNWAELAILGLNKKIDDREHKAWAKYFGPDLKKYGFLEVKSMIMNPVYNWIRDIDPESEEFSESDNFSEWDRSRYGSSRETGHMFVLDFSEENMNKDIFKEVKQFAHNPKREELRGKYFFGFNSSFGNRREIQISTEITRAQYDSYLKYYAELK